MLCHYILPSDNMKPERARSHSGWPCTSSYTPLDLHQSEERKKTDFSCSINDIIILKLCNFIIRPTAEDYGAH